MVLWVFLQTISAFFLSSSDALSKKLLQTNNSKFVAFGKILVSAILVCIFALLFAKSTYNFLVWMAIIVAAFLDTLNVLLYMKAIQISDFSKTAPFTAFTPIGISIVSFFINHEFPTTIGFFGIMLGMAGGYVVNLNKIKEGLHAPIKEIFSNRGTMLTLASVAVLSVEVPINRFAVKHSDPIFAVALMLTFMTLFLFLFSIKDVKNIPGQISTNVKPLLLIGTLGAASSILSFFALSLIQAAYANTVKRLGVLFTVLYGHFIYKEKDIEQHMLAVALMLASVLILAFYG